MKNLMKHVATRGIRMAAFGLAALTLAALAPADSHAQSGILHKRVGPAPRLAAPMGITATQSATVAGPAVTTAVADCPTADCAVAVMPVEIGDGVGVSVGSPGIVQVMPGADGVVAPFDPGVDGPPLLTVPVPPKLIDGDGVVYAMPMGGPDFDGGRQGFDFDEMAATAMPLMMMSGAQRGPANAAANAAPRAGVASPRASASGLPQRAVGLAPRAVGGQAVVATTPAATTPAMKATDATTSAVATDRRDASAAANGIQPVGRQSVTPRRWRDRIRFAWGK